MSNKCQCGFETPLAKCPKCGVVLAPADRQNILTRQWDVPKPLVDLTKFAVWVAFVLGGAALGWRYHYLLFP